VRRPGQLLGPSGCQPQPLNITTSELFSCGASAPPTVSGSRIETPAAGSEVPLNRRPEKTTDPFGGRTFASRYERPYRRYQHTASANRFVASRARAVGPSPPGGQRWRSGVLDRPRMLVSVGQGSDPLRTPARSAGSSGLRRAEGGRAASRWIRSRRAKRLLSMPDEFPASTGISSMGLTSPSMRAVGRAGFFDWRH
jgi:hypothetical protein